VNISFLGAHLRLSLAVALFLAVIMAPDHGCPSLSPGSPLRRIMRHDRRGHGPADTSTTRPRATIREHAP
jgi:hypothetical protein